MIQRLFKTMVAVGVALCASGCAMVGFGYSRGPDVPVVRDPAPIVSGTMRPYQIRGRWYHPVDDPRYEEVGLASWYGDRFHGRPTATGERFDMNAMTAAHKTLPLPGLVEVTNLENGRTVVLRVNDRGPFVDARIIDLSRAAARELGLLERGVGRVRVRYLGRAPRLSQQRAAADGGFEIMARVAGAGRDISTF
jgi:rare lipoprotein A